MNILIIGGFGFVGKHLVHELSKQNHVTIFDDLSNSKKCSTNAKFIIDHTKNINNYHSAIACDLIIHLGEYARIEPSFYDYNKCFDSNIVGTYEVLKFAENKKAKIIYTCSSSIFGDSTSPYEMTKRHNRELIKQFSECTGVEYIICYLCNVYGHGETKETVVEKFINNYINSEPLIINGSGNQKRNFTHINDAISGILCLINNDVTGDDFIIGSETSYTINNLADMFKYDAVKYDENPKGNRSDSKLSFDKMKNLGWRSEYDLQDYILKNLRHRYGTILKMHKKSN